MPRRVSPLEETMRETPAAVIGNSVLLQIINETIGKEVLVETKDGNKFTGIFAGCSPETMDMGLRLAHQITSENEGNLLPKKSEVQEKLQFKYTDVVCMSVLMIEERTIQGFATDREYHESNDDLGVDEGWQQWEGDDESEHVDIEDEGAHPHSRTSKNGGWNVNEMFSKNDQLGVKSTFEEDLSQYSTVDVIDDPEARQRAEQIARQIEGNATSKHNAFLENDDTERDLDKTTEEDEYEMNGRNNNRRSGLGSKSARGIGAPVTNKRAEALKGGPGFGGRGPPIPNNRFIPGTGTYSGSNGKGPDYRDSSSIVKKDGKYENSGFKGKVHLEQRGPSGSPRGNTSDSKEQGGADRRVENLRDWNTQFSNNYQATKDGNTSSEQEKNEETKPSGNAWTKGPPSSLLNSSQASPSATSLSSSQSAPSNDPCDSQPTVNESEDNVQKEEDQNEEAEDNNEEECDEGNADTSSKPPGDPAHKPVEAVKKFTFNLDAPSFVPKSAPTTSTQVVQVQQTPVVQQIPAMMPVQASAPPPMMMTVQPMVMQWPGQQAAVYQASPQGYPYMVNNPTMTAVRPQQGQMTPQMVQAQAGQQRRPPQGQVFVSQQQAAYNPTAVYQTQPAVPVQGFYAGQFTNASVPPPQQYQPMAMAPGQGPAVSMAYVQQQRFVTQPGQQMYVVQQPGVAGAATATRYPTPQQGQPSHEQYSGQPQQGPASQPPTPGPQQPQPVPSPAQSVPLPSQSPAARAYSPHPMAAHAAAPQHQQFFIPPQQHLQQTALFYGQQQQMYYQQQQQMQGIAAAQHAAAQQQQQQQQDGSHAEQMAANAQLQQQYMSHEQYGQQQQYMQQQQGYYPQPPPHVRASSMGQQTQYPQQQSQQGMPQVPPTQSQGPPQQQQQAQTQQ